MHTSLLKKDGMEKEQVNKQNKFLSKIYPTFDKEKILIPQKRKKAAFFTLIINFFNFKIIYVFKVSLCSIYKYFSG